MIDGIKLFCVASPDEIAYLQSIIDFTAKVSTNTGEVNEYRLTGRYRYFDVSIVAGNRLTIQGSIHRSFRNGINHDDFTFSDLKQAIKAIGNELSIDESRLLIQRIEVGVNVRGSPVNYTSLEKNVLIYKNQPFTEVYRGNGLLSVHQRFSLKIYNKSNIEKLPFEIIRFELKITKAIHFKSTGIRTLKDLCTKAKLEQLGAIYLRHFQGILMDNHAAMAICELTRKENDFYLKAQNPKYWKHLSTSMSTSSKRRFRALLQKYTKQDLACIVADIITSQWEHLITH